MQERSTNPSNDQASCVVLMFKAPERSKRRLVDQIGACAAVAADHLLRCALEDLDAWPGPIRFAPADDGDRAWLRRYHGTDERIVEQGDGNLGVRINRVSRSLASSGLERQIFIGSDCPALTSDYIHAADRLLDRHDVVLGPATDGGVVLMGATMQWPDLNALPWSTPRLMAALRDHCRTAGMDVVATDALSDVDSVEDLRAAGQALATDARPARRELCAFIASLGTRSLEGLQ